MPGSRHHQSPEAPLPISGGGWCGHGEHRRAMGCHSSVFLTEGIALAQAGSISHRVIESCHVLSSSKRKSTDFRILAASLPQTLEWLPGASTFDPLIQNCRICLPAAGARSPETTSGLVEGFTANWQTGHPGPRLARRGRSRAARCPRLR